MEKKLNIGGQAVLEGVMMKGPNYWATSVRNEKGKIVMRHEKLKKVPKFFKLFFFRGIYNLIDMLILGMKSLVWSSNVALEEENEKLNMKEVIGILALSFALVITFFVALPYVATYLIGFKEETDPILFNLIDGLIKIVLFIAYVWGISFMKDIRRVFEYHGAEHKTIFCYEDKKELIIKNIKKYGTLHPRCGTSFIMIVFFVAVVVFSLIPALIIHYYPSFIEFSFFIRKIILFSIRILMIPFIAGIAYEILKLSAKLKNNKIIKILIMPGLWIQKITTREPDERQIEVALVSFNKVLELEKTKSI